MIGVVRRQPAQLVCHVRDYGAVADGVTNDASAIKRAIDATHASGGGTVQLMPGVHVVNSAITNAYKDVVIRGFGGRTVIKAGSSFTNGIVNLDAANSYVENVVFQGITFDVSARSNVSGVTIKGGSYAAGAYAKNITFRDCVFKNGGSTNLGLITIYSGRGNTDRGAVTNITIDNCSFDTVPFRHIYLIGGDIKNFSVRNSKFTNSQYGCIDWYQPAKDNEPLAPGCRSNHNFVIDNNVFENNHLSTTSLSPDFMADIRDANRTGVRRLRITNNTFNGRFGQNTTIEQYAMTIHSSWDVIIANNTFWGIRTAFNIGQSYNGPDDQQDGTQMITIRDNTFFRCYNIVDHDSSFFANWSGNKFIEVFYSGIWGYSRHWPSIFANNFFYNTPADPTAGTTFRASAFFVNGRNGVNIKDNVMIDDRKLPDPVNAPTLSAVAGGSLGARTYYAKYTYKNDTGETLASNQATISLASGELCKLTFPHAADYEIPTGAKTIEIYLSTVSGSETLQASIPTAWHDEVQVVRTNQFGPLDWVEPAIGLINGAQLPASNTTKTIMKYGIYEDQVDESRGYKLANVYSGNNIYGVVTKANAIKLRSGWDSVVTGNIWHPALESSAYETIGDGWTSVPASATAPGKPGQRAQDADYMYICTAANTWKRVAISSW